MGDRFYTTVRTLALPLLRGWLGLRVRGIEHVPASGGVLVVANHSSYLDPAVLGRACPRKLHFLIKRSVHEVRGLRWFFRGMDAIPVAAAPQDTGALRAALRVLGRGGAVGIFPEGGRSADGTLRAAQSGVGLLASRSGAVVVPAGIRGAHRAMPVGALIPRPVRVEVHFGPALTFAAGRGERLDPDVVTARIMDEVQRLSDSTASWAGASEAVS